MGLTKIPESMLGFEISEGGGSEPNILMPIAGNNASALQAYFDDLRNTKKSGKLGPGSFGVTNASGPACVLDLSTLTQEAVSEHRRPNIFGDGIGTTVINGGSSGQYAMKINGGSGIAAHHYLTIADLAFSGFQGLHVFDSAYLRLRDIAFQGQSIGMYLESVLSSSFRDLDFRSCGVGLSVAKGGGFSGINANSFRDCRFAFNTGLGLQGQSFSTQLNFNACTFEGNGTQGNGSTGGAVITVNGTEGRVGANFNGCYFENNAGGFDVQLVNAGSAYVTHTFVGCNFQRVLSSNYVTNNIQTFGLNRIVFIGCSFNAYGTYVPSAARPYVGFDGNQIIECYNCHFGSATEQGILVNK